MPFVYKKSLKANSGRVLLPFTLKNSTEFTIGDAVKLASGVLDIVGAGNPVLGILTGFVKADGSPVTDNGAGGDYTADTYTTSSSNTVKGIVDVSLESIYSVNASATLATTSNSDKPGYNFDVVAASDSIDETTPGTGTAQFFSIGPDPSAPTTRLLVTIQESQMKI